MKIILKLISSMSEVQNIYFFITTYWFVKSDFHVKYSPLLLTAKIMNISFTICLFFTEQMNTLY